MTLRVFCCLDMGAALSHHQEGESCEAAVITEPPTMADVIRERKKKAGGAGLGTLRRKIVAAARRPRDQKPDRENEHARYIRSLVSDWRVSEVFLLQLQMEAAAALRELAIQTERARQEAPKLHSDLSSARNRIWCDVELQGPGWSVCCHRALLMARTTYYRDKLHHYPSGPCVVPLDGPLSRLSRDQVSALVRIIYGLDQDKVDSPEWCSITSAIGLSRRSLAQDMAALLHSGLCSDVRLVFSLEGATCGEMSAHRFVLAARSRFFRNILSRGKSVVCLDAQVVPWRFAAPLLHAAYTDLIDLNLVGRNNQSPSNSNSGTNSPWSSVSRTGSSRSAAWIDDGFTLYEIAKFVELQIAVQGCEDVIQSCLSADTWPIVLAQAGNNSQWLTRQCHRFLLDEFWSVLSSPMCGSVPASQLCEALASDELQACEQQVIKGLLKWAEASAKPEGNTSNRRRRVVSDNVLRQQLSCLVPLVRTEHLPRDHDLLNQLIRRGIFPLDAPVPAPARSAAAACLGRGGLRPLRCFLPYLEELRALLEDQEVPEAELARLRRAKYTHRIPDTLYMVQDSIQHNNLAPNPAATKHTLSICSVIDEQLLSALLRRSRELAIETNVMSAQANRQIALRAVREVSLPDECAAMLLEHMDSYDQEHRDLSRGGSARCSSSSLRSLVPINNDGSRSSTSRRELPNRPTEQARQSVSTAVCGLPDVALAPNGNTHLLTTRDYYHHLLTPERGAVLQLDLGDGATHTPRPGSRLVRASRQQSQLQLMRREDDDRPELCHVYDRRASPGRTHRQSYLEYGAVGGATGGNMSAVSGSSQAYDSSHYRQYRLSQCSPNRGPSPRLA